MIDNTLVIKNLQKLEHIFMIFSQYTKMPYVECNPETYDDQIHIFSDQEDVQAFAKEYTEKKILLMAKQFPKTHVAGVLTSMYALGVNAVVFHHNGTVAHLQLDQIVKRPANMEELLQKKPPVMNPTLMLSAMYFLEELCRPVEHDKVQLRELEEEVIANLVRSDYIVAVVHADPNQKLDPTQKDQPKAINFLKDKDGQIFMPVFSDTSEFQKFYRDKVKEVAMLVMPFRQLSKHLMKDAKGLALNPGGFNLQIGREQLDKIMSTYYV